MMIMCVYLSLCLNLINFIHLDTALHSQVFGVIWGAGQLQLAVVDFLINSLSNCWFNAFLHVYETIYCWFNPVKES